MLNASKICDWVYSVQDMYNDKKDEDQKKIYDNTIKTLQSVSAAHNTRINQLYNGSADLERKIREKMNDGRRKEALLLLKKKKRLDIQSTSLEKMIDNLDNYEASLNLAYTANYTTAKMRSCARDLQKISGKDTINDIEKVHDDMQDFTTRVQEIQDSLSSMNIDNIDVVNDTDEKLLQELESMMNNDYEGHNNIHIKNPIKISNYSPETQFMTQNNVTDEITYNDQRYSMNDQEEGQVTENSSLLNNVEKLEKILL